MGVEHQPAMYAKQYTNNETDHGIPMHIIPTLPKTNMEPKNGGLEHDFPFQKGAFQVPC